MLEKNKSLSERQNAYKNDSLNWQFAKITQKW